MAVNLPAVSDTLSKALKDGITDFLGKNDPLVSMLRSTKIAVRVFTLGLREIANGQGLASALPAGWRFMAGQSPDRFVAADVVSRNGGQPRLTSVSRDPIIGKFLNDIRDIENMPEVKEGRYELRELRLPGLAMEVLWLRSQTGGSDLIVPILTLAAQLETSKVYREDRFLEIVRPLTSRFLAFADVREDAPPRNKQPNKQK